jgi:hypothetical protein
MRPPTLEDVDELSDDPQAPDDAREAEAREPALVPEAEQDHRA